jgi:hypothetical protein
LRISSEFFMVASRVFIGKCNLENSRLVTRQV